MPTGTTAVTAAVESLPFGVATTDADGNITWANAAYAQLTGCTPDELLGQSAGAFDWDALAQPTPSSEPWRGQAVCMGKTGEAYSVEHSITALRDPAGEITGFWIMKRDATEIKRPAGTPYQAEANLSALIESTDDLIGSFDLEYKLLTFNKALQASIKSSIGVQATVGMRPDEWIPPERVALWIQMFDRALSEGSFREEYVLLDGRTLELSFNPIRQDGRTTGISVFGKDVTERKVAEKGLREAETKYRHIFDGALEGLYQTSIEGKPITGNLALARMLGYESPAEGLHAVTDVGLQVWLDANERSRFMKLLQDQGVVRGYEGQLKRKDGTTLWASLNSRIVKDVAGETPYIEGFVEDITERKRTEGAMQQANDAVAEAERHYRLMFNSVSDAVFVSQLREDGLPGRFIEVNDRACEYLGYSRDELLRMGPHDITAPEAKDSIKSIRETLLAVGNGLFETVNIGKNGKRIPVEVNAHLFGSRGETRLISSVRDISDRMEAERRYRDIFENALEGIYRTSIEGTILTANPALAKMLGFDSAEEFVSAITHSGSQVWLDPDERHRYTALLEDCGGVLGFEAQFKRKDSTLLWVSISGRRV